MKTTSKMLTALAITVTLFAGTASPVSAETWLDGFRRDISRPARSMLPERLQYSDVKTKTSRPPSEFSLAWVYDGGSTIHVAKSAMKDFIDREGAWAAQVVMVHEWGHLIAYREGVDLDAWLEAATGGEIIGAPDAHEMFSECIARIFTGETPEGYRYKCSKRRAQQATWDAIGG